MVLKLHNATKKAHGHVCNFVEGPIFSFLQWVFGARDIVSIACINYLQA